MKKPLWSLLMLLAVSAPCGAAEVDPIRSEPAPQQGGEVQLKDGSVKSTIKSTGKEAGHGVKEAGKEVGQGFKKGGQEVKRTVKGLWNELTD